MDKSDSEIENKFVDPNIDEKEYDLPAKCKLTKKQIAIIISASAFSICLIAVLIVIFILKKKKKTHKEFEKFRLKGWEMINSNLTELSGEEISLGKGDNFIKSPSDWEVATAMGILVGDSNDIFFEKKLKEVDAIQFDDPWWFRSSFQFKDNKTIENLEKNDINVLLHIYGINYKADIYIDGHKVADKDLIQGTFVKYSINISPYISISSKVHYIALLIYRPHNMWSSSKYFDQLDLAITFVDWNPEPPDSNLGVWQPMEITAYPRNTTTIVSSFVITNLTENENKANLSVVIHAKNWENYDLYNKFKIKIGNFLNIEIKDILIPAETEKEIFISYKDNPKLIIKNPKLWWPYQMGNPTLHKYQIEVYTKKATTSTNISNNYNSTPSDIYSTKIGLRQITSEMSSDNKIKVFKINNKKLMIKGGGWTPDIFLRESKSIYLKHFNYVRHMELNAVRLEGKSEHEEFYQIADELGILIIQGWSCSDSWQRWKYWKPLQHEIALRSMKTQMRKLSVHPSVLVFIMGSDVSPTEDVEKEWRDLFTLEKWPNEILASADEVPSPYSGPTGVKMKGLYSWVPPNFFYFDNEMEYAGDWGFLTEGSPGQNPLRKGSYLKVFRKDSIKFPLDDNWNYHCGNKKLYGDLHALIDPINSRYGNIVDFQDFERKSMAAVYDSHRTMFEAYELNRYVSTGIINWMLNNAWPSNIWHLYDYFFSPTPAYFAAKKAGEKLHPIYSFRDKSIHLTNNYFKDFKKDINIYYCLISGYDGRTILEEHETVLRGGIKGDSSIKLFNVSDIKDNDVDTFFIYIEINYIDEKGKNVNSNNIYWINKVMDEWDYKNMAIIKYANLTCIENIDKTEIDIKRKDKKGYSEFTITNLRNTIAFMIELQLYDNDNNLITPVFWSDNYFSILPKKSYTITVNYDYPNIPRLEIFGWNIDKMTLE